MEIEKFSVKEFPREVVDIVKDNNLSIYLAQNLDRYISWFNFNKFICINADKDIYTQRFTLCHELGHNILRHRFWDTEEEKEADDYACNLLVDDTELINKAMDWRSLFDLQTLFWVPARELLKRLKSLFPNNTDLLYAYF